MSNKIYKRYLVTIIIFFLMTLIPLMIISFYNHPSVDDFSYGKWNHNVWLQTHSLIAVLKSAVETSRHFWNNWGGLYTSAFLLSLQPAIFAQKYYALTGFINMGSLLVACLILSMLILHKELKISKLEAFTLGTVTAVMMIQWMPSGTSGLYWYNGSINYTMFFSIMLVTITMSIYTNCALSEKSRRIRGIFTSLLAVLLAGGNHVSAFSGLLFLTGMLLFILIRRKKGILFGGVIPLAANVVGFLFNILSPGTKARQAAFEDRPGVIKTIWLSSFQGCKYINEWFNMEKLICVVLMLPILYGCVKYLKGKGFRFGYPLLVTILSVGYICAMLCPPYYAMGWEGSGRLTNVIYFAFIILLFVNVTYWLGWVAAHVKDGAVGRFILVDKNSKWYVYLPVCMLFSLICFSVTDSHAFTAVNTLTSGAAAVYNKEYYARDALLSDSAGKDVVVDSFSVRPRLLYFDDISEDPTDWRNNAMSAYYQLNSVVKKSDE